jgi:hypothetical protein
MDLMGFDNSIGGAHAMCPYRWNSLIFVWDLVPPMAEGFCGGNLNILKGQAPQPRAKISNLPWGNTS